jgi:DNA topoisomerase-1
MNLVKAQQTRQILDILIGYKITPFLWREFYTKKTASLSAGRCQTPALRLVYDNAMEGKQKIPETHYKTTGLFTARNIPFDLQHTFADSEQVVAFLDATKTAKHTLECCEASSRSSAPPKPFTTSRLLQVASNQLHYSPKETMRLCQELYQQGHITYMRTECSHYSLPFLTQASEYITGRWAGYVGSLDKIENKNNALPHEAIRVTHCEVDSLQLENKKAATLYRLIWRNTIESCMSEYRYQTVDIILHGAMDISWKHTIEIPLFLGWKKVMQSDITASDQNNPVATLQYFKSLGESSVTYSVVQSVITLHNKHQHFSEASLIHTLETMGIGRPSTYASLIDTIKDREYVKCQDVEGVSVQCTDHVLEDGVIKKTTAEKQMGSEKKKLVIQPLGILIIEFLMQHFTGLFEYTYTSDMETRLDDISKGLVENEQEICSQCVGEIQTYSDHFKQYKKENPASKPTPQEKVVVKPIGQYKGEDLYIRVGKYGPYIQYGETSENCAALLESSQKTVDTITFDDVVAYLDNKPFKIGKDVLRVLNKDMSVRKGKYGAYVFYKRSDMPAPKFFNLRGFSEGWAKCEVGTLIGWVAGKYGLE